MNWKRVGRVVVVAVVIGVSACGSDGDGDVDATVAPAIDSAPAPTTDPALAPTVGTDAAVPDDPGVAAADDSAFDALYDAQQGTLAVVGAATANETFSGFDVDCTLWDDGELFLSSYPDDDGWSVEVVVPGVATLAPGEFTPNEVLVYPPESSELGADGTAFVSDTGTLTIATVGDAQEFEGEAFYALTASFESTVASEADGATATATGTFDCVTYVAAP